MTECHLTTAGPLALPICQPADQPFLPNRDNPGFDPGLFEACLCRSQTLAQPETFSDRYPTVAQMREWVKEPVAYRIEYADGLKLTMLQLNGLVKDFTFAARLRGQPEPLSTLFYLPPNPNVAYSAPLMSKAEQLFLTGHAAYPVERTLLTSGLVAAARPVARRRPPHRDAAPDRPLPGPAPFHVSAFLRRE